MKKIRLPKLAVVLCLTISALTAACSPAVAVKGYNETFGEFDYTIRELTDNDILKIETIAKSVFKGHTPETNQVIDFISDPEYPKFMTSLMNWQPFDGFGFGVEVDGMLVAYITAGFISQQTIDKLLRAISEDNDGNNGDTPLAGCYISEVAVLPYYRRAGLAEALMREVFKRAGSQVVSLHVESKNEKAKAARALYSKLGFTTKLDDGNTSYMTRSPQH